MKKIILAVLSAIVLISCQEPFATETIKYDANVKGYAGPIKEYDNKQTYNIISIDSVVNGWDGMAEVLFSDPKQMFVSSSSDKRLVVVYLKALNTGSEDLGINEMNFELYDSVNKKTYTTEISEDIDLETFDAISSSKKSGYVVFDVPVEVNLNDLYVAYVEDTTDGMGALSGHDWSKEDINTLITLKKLPFDNTQKSVAYNMEKIVGDDSNQIKYTIKSLVSNFNDEAVIKEVFEYYPNQTYYKLEVDVENISSQDIYLMSDPVLNTTYDKFDPKGSSLKINGKISPQEKKSTSFYYAVPTGVEVSELLLEYGEVVIPLNK